MARLRTYSAVPHMAASGELLGIPAMVERVMACARVNLVTMEPSAETLSSNSTLTPAVLAMVFCATDGSIVVLDQILQGTFKKRLSIQLVHAIEARLVPEHAAPDVVGPGSFACSLSVRKVLPRRACPAGCLKTTDT